MEVIIDEPVSEFHVEIFMRSESILVPEMIIDHSPKSLYFTIGLRSSNLSIFVDNIQLNKECFETMGLITLTLLI
jgi:hypothetical protein